MKSAIVFLLSVLVITTPLTDNEIVNEVFYGLFAQNRLAKPEVCVKCFDDVTAKKIVNFVDTILPQAVKVVPPIQKLKQ